MDKRKIDWVHLWVDENGPHAAIGRKEVSPFADRLYHPTPASARRLSEVVRVLLGRQVGRVAPSCAGIGWSWRK